MRHRPFPRVRRNQTLHIASEAAPTSGPPSSLAGPQREEVSGGPVTRHPGLLPETTSGGMTFSKSLDRGDLGEREGKQGHTPFWVSPWPHSEVVSGKEGTESRGDRAAA